MPTEIQIGQAVRQAGLSIDAIRFYERRGLLRRTPRSAGGFRQFAPQDVASLRFVRVAQGLGFSLREIQELLVLRERPEHACPQVRRLLQQKLEAVEDKIRELTKLRRTLAGTLEKCARELRNRGDAHKGVCPVLKGMLPS